MTRMVIIGGGPAGTSAATHAARFGADVTLIERDIIGALPIFGTVFHPRP